MKRVVTIAMIFLVAAAVAPALAQAPAGAGMHPRNAMGPGSHTRGPDAFERHLYPPDLVLSNQIAIGLTEDQLTEIKKALNETHAKIIDIQTDLQRVTERLSGLLAGNTVDEAAAMAAADEAMSLEVRMKTVHLGILIRVKNLLTPEQQEQLDMLRGKAGWRPRTP